MSGQAPSTVTMLLEQCSSDSERLARLLPVVYDRLHSDARAQLAGERPDHTLSPTALVSEAYLKLVGPRDVPWLSRRHFYVAAAQAMRQILVDHARARCAGKRGGTEARRAALDLATGMPDLGSEPGASGFLILNDAIARLEEVDPDAASVVRLRFFAGLTVEQAAAALGVSEPTVKRNWAFARGWLKEAIESERV